MHTLGGQLLWTQAPTLPDSDLAPGHALHLHRIVREAISNAVVHGAANAISIAVDHADYRLHLSIRDDGHGIDTHSPQGRGTRNMRARTATLGGSIEWKASTPSGTEVQLSLPLALESARIPS